MKINFNTGFKNLKGEAIKDEKGKDLILYDVCSNALLFNKEGKEDIEGKEKVKRFKLAHKIYGVKEPVSIEVEDVALIKDLVAKLYSTLIVGQVWELLEGEKSI